MTGEGALLALTLAVPLALLVSCLSPRQRQRAPALLALAPAPALVAAIACSGGMIVLPGALLGLTLALDAPGAMLLGVAALLWIAAGLYASATLRGAADAGRFAVWWLLTLTGSLGVFVAADLVGFYLVFAMVSLAAYGLVVHDGTPRARRAGSVYVALAVLGEAFLLMGFVLLAQATPGGSLLIRDGVAALPNSPWREATLALLMLGFGIKIGLIPFHVWMPLAYSAAPIPAAAVLSGAAVKAGVIGLIRFLPMQTALPDWGAALAAVGLASAFYGVAIGITQRNPKTVLAYSSISQMGVLAAVFGAGLATGDGGAALIAAFYAAHHVLVKGGLFLAVGVMTATGRRCAWQVLLPAAILALSLAGLPFTGGALAKLAIKTPLGSGLVGFLATLSAAGTTLLMLHYLRRLMTSVAMDDSRVAPATLALPWLVTAAAAVLAPWLLYVTVLGGGIADVLDLSALASAVWPILLGAVLAAALWRWGDRMPGLPAGDVVVAARPVAGLARAIAEGFEVADVSLRRWPVAGLLLLILAAGLGAALLAGH